MTNWINWNGGECPIKSNRTRVEIKFSTGYTAINKGQLCRWEHVRDGSDIFAYRIIEDHEPMTQTREQITAQIEALQKQLDAMPVVSRVVWGAAGTYYFTYDEVVETINGVPHIHGIAMKEVDQA